MWIDHLLHGYDLGVPATCGTALDAERGAERRLTKRQHGQLTDPLEALGEANGHRRLPLAERCRIGRGNEDVLRTGRAHVVKRIEGHLGDAGATVFEVVRVDAHVGGDVHDWSWFDRSCDLKVCSHARDDTDIGAAKSPDWLGGTLP
jgi:hypothetical protein